MRRIIIADDHVLIRRGLIQVLRHEFPEALIAEVGDAEALMARIREAEWDLVITDISMPGKSGLDILREIRQHAAKLPVLVVSMLPDEQYAIRALKAGANGYVNKMSSTGEIIKAIRAVEKGKRYLTAEVAEQMADNLQQYDNRAAHETLSAREFEIFHLIAAGKSVAAIAAQLTLSTSSISTYRARVLDKMHLQNNADIIFYCIEHKLA